MRPEAGKALVFLQSEMHAGTPVVAENLFDEAHRKYILLTEVFYEKVREPDDAWAPESIALLREARDHEEAGAFEDAIRCYGHLRRTDPEFARCAGVP